METALYNYCCKIVYHLYNTEYYLETKLPKRLDVFKGSYLLRGFTEPSRLLFASPSSNTSLISSPRLCSIRSAFQVGTHPILGGFSLTISGLRKGISTELDSGGGQTYPELKILCANFGGTPRASAASLSFFHGSTFSSSTRSLVHNARAISSRISHHDTRCDMGR